MIAVITAMEVELELIRRTMAVTGAERVAGGTCWLGTLCGQELVAAVCGVGKVSAAQCTQAIISRFAPEAVLHSGIAGGIQPGLRHLDVVCARELTYRDMSEEVKRSCLPMGGYYLADPVLTAAVLRAEPSCRLGCIATGDLFVSDPEEKQRLHADYHALCADMESAAVGQVCAVNRVPFAAIRCISDLADDDATVDYETFEQAAAHKSARLLCRVIQAWKNENK